MCNEKMSKSIFQVIKSLENNNMKGYFVRDEEELLLLIARLIPKKTTIGCGDSVTLEQMGVFEYIRNNDYIFYDKHIPNLAKEIKRNFYIKNFDADTFITGTNAVTLDGKLFNIDGNGSRVAPMLFGPKQVIVVVGTNKIVENEKEALFRTRQIAAVKDAKRLNRDTPCTKLNKCIDCKHKNRICNDFVLITGQFIKDRIKVIIVDDKLGY